MRGVDAACLWAIALDYEGICDANGSSSNRCARRLRLIESTGPFCDVARTGPPSQRALQTGWRAGLVESGWQDGHWWDLSARAGQMQVEFEGP